MKADGDYNNYKPLLTYWTFTITDNKEMVQSYYWGGNSNGSQNNPFIISDVKGWNFLCDSLAKGDSFSGKCFRLDNNITVCKMAGSSGHKFKGIFNGNGNTLTFNYNTAMIPPSRNMLLLSDLSIVAVQSKICTPQVIFIPLSNMRQVLSVHRTVPFPLKTVVSALLSIVL